MVELRRLLGDTRAGSSTRWLWFLAAYRAVIVVLSSVASYVGAPAATGVGSSD